MGNQELTMEDFDGVGPGTADKLKEAGYKTWNQVAMERPSQLSEINGVGDSTAESMVEEAREKLNVGGIQSAQSKKEMLQDMDRLSVIVDGVERTVTDPEADDYDEPHEVDALFGGGIEPRCLTEVNGKYGAGKSQITHQLCVNVQLPKRFGGLEGRAMFIDTEDTFRPERIEQMVRGLPENVLENELVRRGIDGSVDDPEAMDELVTNFLDKINFLTATDSEHQIRAVDELAEPFVVDKVNSEWPVKLIVLDSLMAHFRAEYTGRGKLAKRQQKIGNHLGQLDHIASTYDMPVVLTNQMVDSPGTAFGDPKSAIGGNIVGHRVRFRTRVKPRGGEDRVIEMVKSAHLNDGEAPFSIPHNDALSL